jgi:N-glycosidase YbiA
MIGPFRDKYRFLSNFQRCPIIYDGIFYPSAEHAYVAAKTLDIKERVEISLIESSGKAKKYGQTMNVRPDWDKIKYEVMEKIVRIKFHNTELREMLLATGDEELVELNTWGDVTWGVCNGIGENWLGKILMEVRSELRKENG